MGKNFNLPILKNNIDSYISKINNPFLQDIKISKSPTKTELLKMQAFLQGEIAKGNKDFKIFKAISILAETIKINHELKC